ncbi:MAG: hypothetical protein AB1486_29845 [Planctomycetota bacterium]
MARLSKDQALDNVVRLYRGAFIDGEEPEGQRILGGLDYDPLAEALGFLEVCFEGEEREALERQLLEWAVELEQLLASAGLDVERLSSDGTEALQAAQGELAARLARQRSELIEVLRATGKEVPESSLDLDRPVTPELLAEAMRRLSEVAAEPPER